MRPAATASGSIAAGDSVNDFQSPGRPGFHADAGSSRPMWIVWKDSTNLCRLHAGA